MAFPPVNKAADNNVGVVSSGADWRNAVEAWNP